LIVVFFQATIEALVVFGIDSVLGSLLFLIFRNYIRRHIEEWLYASLSEYIRSQLEISLRNPKATAEALKPLIEAIIQEVLKDFQSGQKEAVVKVPFLGKIPSPIVQALVERFLGGGSKSGNSEGNNPFA
jgi:Arc/MetJ-type ribon-helix-helix transcriptional regulator